MMQWVNIIHTATVLYMKHLLCFHRILKREWHLLTVTAILVL